MKNIFFIFVTDRINIYLMKKGWHIIINENHELAGEEEVNFVIEFKIGESIDSVGTDKIIFEFIESNFDEETHSEV